MCIIYIHIYSIHCIYQDFLQLDKLVSDNFSTSLSTFEAKSITQLSKLYYFHSCCKYNSIALISPPSSLYNLMKKECRFGYIHAERSVISPKSDSKFYMSLDYSKYYLNLLSSMKNHLYNTPITYAKVEGKYVREKGVNFNCLANLLFSSLEYVTEENFIYGLRAKELRILNLPNDLVYIDCLNRMNVLSFFGVYLYVNSLFPKFTIFLSIYPIA